VRNCESASKSPKFILSSLLLVRPTPAPDSVASSHFDQHTIRSKSEENKKSAKESKMAKLKTAHSSSPHYSAPSRTVQHSLAAYLRPPSSLTGSPVTTSSINFAHLKPAQTPRPHHCNYGHQSQSSSISTIHPWLITQPYKVTT